MDLQPYGHDCFSKNIAKFVWFPKQYLLGFFILEKFLTGVSCFSVTLFYSTFLALTDRQNDGQRVEYTRFVWAGGTFFPVVRLCCVSFWFLREMRELALHYFPADCCGVKREIVFGVTYLLSVQYSCAVVSVFFVVAGKLILFKYLTAQLFSKILRTFFVKKWSHEKPTYKKTNSFLLCLDLQPYSHYCFSKFSIDFLNNTFWVSLF
jgi:hypothetical protein